MCEILAVHWPSARPFRDVMPWAEKIEHYGFGRFGWGVAWLDDGRVGSHLLPGSLREDAELLVFNAYPQNRMFRFRTAGAEVAATELHSADDSLFTLVFPEATDRQAVRDAEAVATAVSP